VTVKQTCTPSLRVILTLHPGNSMEAINFVHDVNTLRKNMKQVYSSSADLRAYNSERGDGPGNCRIQVLPVCWRHLLDFPKKRERKKEYDLGTAFMEEDDCKYSPEWVLVF